MKYFKLIITIILFCFISFNSFSQDFKNERKILTFVEGGVKHVSLTVEESINLFDLSHTLSMINSYENKLSQIVTLDLINTEWVVRVKKELVLLYNRKNKLEQ